MARRPVSRGAWISRTLAALALLAPLGGCTSPESAGDPMVRGVAAVGLTYANGDEKAGTVTVASLPFLSFYRWHEDPKTHDHGFRLCWIPLLASFESGSHDIRDVVATLPAPPSCPEDEPPPPPRKGRIVIRTTEYEEEAPRPSPRPAPATRPAPAASPAPTAATPPPSSATPSTTGSASPPVAPTPPPSEPARPDPASARAERPATPKPARPAPRANGARILDVQPATRTEVDVVFPLFHVERERPGAAVIQRPGRGKSVVEVGDSQDHVRALPLFSYRRDAERERLILWPLLASGYDDDAEGRHLVLFYFLRIRTGDPEKN